MGIGIALSHKSFEDPLAYLPCSPVREYSRGQIIYSPTQPSTSILLVIEGAVKVCRMTESGMPVLLDLYHTDDFFGESAFLGQSQHGTETAIAVERSKVMAW